MTTEIVHHGGTQPPLGVNVDPAAILRHLGLDPAKAETQALVMVCERYGLDPILKHAVLIGPTVYVSRDGLLHNAHRSGLLDGIELLEQDETPSHWTARVAVYRKDMGRPFVYPGRYPKDGSNKKYGPEMAVKVAEVMALRRAFNITVPTVEEQWDLEAQQASTRAPQRRAIQAPAPDNVDAPDDYLDPDTPWADWGPNEWLEWGTRAHVGRPELQAAGGPLRSIASLSVVATAPDHIKARVYALGGGVA